MIIRYTVIPSRNEVETRDLAVCEAAGWVGQQEINRRGSGCLTHVSGLTQREFGLMMPATGERSVVVDLDSVSLSEALTRSCPRSDSVGLTYESSA